jgi:hypothetical protein
MISRFTSFSIQDVLGIAWKHRHTLPTATITSSAAELYLLPDIITGFADQTITDTSELNRAVASLRWNMSTGASRADTDTEL